MISALIGSIVTVVAVWGVVVFRSEFLLVCKGLFPICFVFGGLIAVISGISGWRESSKK